MKRAGWMGLLLCGLISLSCIGVGGANPIGMLCTCTKLSDTELRIDCMTDHHDHLYYYYVYSDNSIEQIALENTIIAHTFSSVSLSSFPLGVSVYVYADITGRQLEYQADEVIDCCSLFAPEIDLSESGNPIGDGTSHDVGDNSTGKFVLEFTVDNSAGAGPLNITDVAAIGLTNCSAFDVITTLPLVVLEGSSSVLRVSFDIDQPEAFQLDLSITNNDLDEDPYNVRLIGNGITPLQAAQADNALQVLPRGAGGDDAFLDSIAPLDELGDPILSGSTSLSGFYAIGETISGAALICDPSLEPQCTLWLHLFLYAVDLETRPETLALVEHWTENFDRARGAYTFEHDTSELAPGVYDLYISHPGGPGEVLRIQLVQPLE